jgi:sortase A
MAGAKMRWMLRTERLLIVIAAILLTVFLAARLHRTVLSRAAIKAFTHSQNEPLKRVAANGTLSAAPPDFSLWSPKRVEDYKESLTTDLAPAVGVLRIPKVDIEAPVLEGTDDLTLNRGIGRIDGTARVGESGNIGIAGHRDGFFRGLKDVSTGDKIELITKEGTQTYIVDRIVIVERADVSVLAPRDRSSVTLVTCYPFYFVGSAPERYIVQAYLADGDRRQSAALQPATR